VKEDVTATRTGNVAPVASIDMESIGEESNDLKE